MVMIFMIMIITMSETREKFGNIIYFRKFYRKCEDCMNNSSVL